jgi:hypothetical protein
MAGHIPIGRKFFRTEGGRTFDIDAFLEFMPGQEGKSVKSVLPLSTAPLAEKIFFSVLFTRTCLMLTSLSGTRRKRLHG